MKTKVVRVAMPSTKRIWFLKPPNSPRLESSLDKTFKGLVSGLCKKVPLLNLVDTPVQYVPVEELLANLLI